MGRIAPHGMAGKVKALVLLSGGLDSTLAVRIMQELGVEIVALNFFTSFCLCGKRAHGGNGAMGCGFYVKELAARYKFEYRVFNISEEFLKIVKDPPHGYGSNMNPCIDCRIHILRRAKDLMPDLGARFVVTGEVLNQRPMSQRRHPMFLIERESGLEGLILRPLSAKLLPPTIPEKEGWVDREKLLSINGRSRKEQFRVARDLSVYDFPCPAGGCLLTDPAFAKRIKEALGQGDIDLNDVELLKTGRHFRLAAGVKLVIGRNEGENNRLERLARDGDVLFAVKDVMGPTGLLRGAASGDGPHLDLSAAITVRYSDAPYGGEQQVEMRMAGGGKEEIKLLRASAADPAAVDGYRVN